MEGDAGWYYHSGGTNDWDLNAVVRYACGGRGRVSPPPPSSDDPFSTFCPPPPAPPQELTTGDRLFGANTSLPDLPFDGNTAAVDELSTAFFGPPAPPLAPHLPLQQQQQQEQAMATNDGPVQMQQAYAAPPPAGHLPLQPQQQQAMATNDGPVQMQQGYAAPPPAGHLPLQQHQQAMATNGEPVQMQQDYAPPPPPVPQTSGLQASGGEGSSKSKQKKKRPPVQKEVKRVAADGVSADPWAWRKYGQKPIKGSPYPRGYYRCSTEKACEARKMVERCRDDPDSFILTYTGGDHNHPAPIHRNSLAGTTRNKQQHAAGGHIAPGGAAATAVAMAAQPSPGQSTSGGTSASPTTSPRSPSVDDCNQEEAPCDEAGGASKDVEMEAEEDDELKKLLDTAIGVGGDCSSYAAMEVDGGAGVSPFLNVVEETFVVTPWVTALGDATGWS